jgi:hypothetical protein
MFVDIEIAGRHGERTGSGVLSGFGRELGKVLKYQKRRQAPGEGRSGLTNLASLVAKFGNRGRDLPRSRPGVPCMCLL